MARRSDTGLLIGATVVVMMFGAVAIYLALTYRPFWIPAGSMKPTLLVGDYLVVNQAAYGRRCFRDFCWRDPQANDPEPQRGDVIVFRHPVGRYDFIKRLIGVPGDQVQLIHGVIYLNGVPQAQTELGLFTEDFAAQGPHGQYPTCSNSASLDDALCEKTLVQESLDGGGTHSILDIVDNGYVDDTTVFTVPEGHYFFMGDNRDNSVDSRSDQAVGGVGFVPRANLKGRAERVLFSSAGADLKFFWNWRSDRFFKAIQ